MTGDGEDLLFTTVVRPQKAEALVRALLACEGVSSCHAIEVRGSGNQRPTGQRAVLGFLPKVAVVGSVQPAAQDAFEALIQAHCPTGQSGDGKIFYQTVTRVIELCPSEVGD